MINRKEGNQFETELCELLSEEGFWCHNLAQDAAGQPADVIAVKEGQAYLIDCKICSRNRFQFTRIEENQRSAMELWRECGNGEGWFALQFSGQIYMVDIASMDNCQRLHSSMTEELASTYGVYLGEWLWVRR